MTPLLDATGLAITGRLAATQLVSGGNEMIALVGPNGSGKTSLLRALARVEEASGTVLVDGQDLDQFGEARRRRLIAFLPAARDVAWPISVRDIVTLGGGAEGKRNELIHMFGLSALADRAITSLSTGERARALLARALSSEPRLLLLDEPLANLDPYWTLRTLNVLAAQSVRGATLLVSLHDLAMIERFDRLLLLDGGKVVADGTPAALAGQIGPLFGVEPAPDGRWRLPGA